MGIRGLRKEVKEQDGAWDNFYSLADTRLVMDGDNVLYSLLSTSGDDYCRTDTRHVYGGQYSDLYDRIVHFFAELRQRRVLPVVVLDGIEPEGQVKQNEVLERMKGEIKDAAELAQIMAQGALHQKKHLPGVGLLWLYEVFYEALAKMEVPVLVADTEGDPIVAALARLWNCPVLSGDGDFFIYDLPAGLILPDDLLYSMRLPLPRPPKAPRVCQRYFRKRLMQSLAGKICPDPGRLRNITPAVACERLVSLAAGLAGNDFTKRYDHILNKVLGARKRKPPLRCALNWLLGKGCETVEEGLGAVGRALKTAGASLTRDEIDFLEALRYSVEFYDAASPARVEDAERFLQVDVSSLRPANSGSPDERFPQWFVRSFRLRDFPEFVMNFTQQLECRLMLPGVYLEDVAQEAAAEADKSLRQILYGILQSKDSRSSCPGAREVVRRGVDVVEMPVKPTLHLPRFGELPGVHDIEAMDKRSRRGLVLESLSTTEEHVQDLPIGWQLPVATVRHWVQATRAFVAASAGGRLSVVQERHVLALLVQMINGCPAECRSTGPSYSGDAAPHLISAAIVEKMHLSKEDAAGAHAAQAAVAADPPAVKSVPPCAIDVSLVHMFIQWQRVVNTGFALNALLRFPFPRPMLHAMFDGVAAYGYASDPLASTGDSASIREAASDRDLLARLYAAVADLFRHSLLQ